MSCLEMKAILFYINSEELRVDKNCNKLRESIYENKLNHFALKI